MSSPILTSTTESWVSSKPSSSRIFSRPARGPPRRSSLSFNFSERSFLEQPTGTSTSSSRTSSRPGEHLGRTTIRQTISMQTTSSTSAGVSPRTSTGIPSSSTYSRLNSLRCRRECVLRGELIGSSRSSGRSERILLNNCLDPLIKRLGTRRLDPTRLDPVSQLPDELKSPLGSFRETLKEFLEFFCLEGPGLPKSIEARKDELREELHLGQVVVLPGLKLFGRDQTSDRKLAHLQVHLSEETAALEVSRKFLEIS